MYALSTWNLLAFEVFPKIILLQTITLQKILSKFSFCKRLYRMTVAEEAQSPFKAAQMHH